MAAQNENDSLLDRIRTATSDQTSTATESVRAELLGSQAPDWSKYAGTKSAATDLAALSMGMPAEAKKAAFEHKSHLLSACMKAVGVTEDVTPARWILTLICDMLREDSSCFGLFENVSPAGPLMLTVPLLTAIQRQGADQYVADRAAWLLSAVIGHSPTNFKQQQVQDFLDLILRQNQTCSEVGVLDAAVNVMKANVFRAEVWNRAAVSGMVMGVAPQTAPPANLYKCVFAMWLLSFEDDAQIKLQADVLVKKVREILCHSRVEKVVRLSLTVLKNLLARPAFAEEVVEQALLEVVQQLEYEKWRDTELYDEIRDLASMISTRVQDMTNFDRYERELQEGHLKWGFIHSSKFFVDNVLKFEQNDFRALKLLGGLLDSSDPTTLAVACHDIGEFVATHPLGKKQISRLHVKERVMELMSSADSAHRDVRREALLCCQKMMLNKWQDMDTAVAVK